VETLLVERADGVMTVTLNRPEKKNAINGTMWTELLTTFEDAATDPAVRVVVLTGAGGAFCSGADLSPGGGRGEAHHQLVRMRQVADVALRLHRIPKPVIAKVGGVATGAGCNMALGCDLIVASEDARFSEIFARRGLSIDGGGSWVLPRVVGLQKAKELALLADIIPATEAVRIGLVSRVVPRAELDATVASLAGRLAAGPPLALSATKRLLGQGLDVSLAQALEAEAQAQAVNFGTRDTAEAMRAFVEKREPTFEGR
jgi:2-(1,2-epoxy-1,2-dihydrophenyl)acetyl-CoA isomerase